MKIETHTMPAHWATALINSEDSRLERFNGLLTECLEYSFLRDR